MSSRQIPTEPASTMRVVPVRHPWQIVSGIVVIVIAAAIIQSMVLNPRFHWELVWRYFGSSQILSGLRVTIELTIVSMAIGIVLGAILAVMRLSTNPVLSGSSWVYLWLFRGVPELVQVLFWYNLAALYPRLSVGIPFGPQFFSVDTNSVITPMVAAIASLGLVTGAYMCEIIRAGILSVGEGQIDAAQSLGMPYALMLRRIIFPQAMRVILPPTGNMTISMLKITSLVSVTSVTELLFSAQIISATTFQTIPVLVTASLWYLIMTSILTVSQYYLERGYARGSSRRMIAETPLQWMANNFFRFRLRPSSASLGREGLDK